MHVAMIGTGYVGLVSGACFADFGHTVTCVDKDARKIEALLRGEIPIFEPDLDRLVASNVKAGRLKFTTDLRAPVAEADTVFIAVGTPSRRGDGYADLTHVHQVAREIRSEIREVEEGKADKVNNVLKNAPHTAAVITADEWTKPYSRQKAAYPLPFVKEAKFWPSVSRVDNAYGDRNLVCSCLPMDVYASHEVDA